MANQVQGILVHPPPVPAVPQAPQTPPVPQAPQGQQFVHLNWSNFKPEMLYYVYFTSPKIHFQQIK